VEAVRVLLENGACPETPSVSQSEHTTETINGKLVNANPPVRPLHLACLHGSSDVVNLLLRYHTNADSIALHLACRKGHTDTIRELLNHGVDPNQPDPHDTLPIHAALWYWHEGKENNLQEICQLLLEKMNPAAVNQNHGYALSLACQMNDLDLVRLLVEWGADIKLCTPDDPPLHIACSEGHLELVKLLVDLGADINLESKVWSIRCRQGLMSPL
jgi:ankyrin repeat protein